MPDMNAAEKMDSETEEWSGELLKAMVRRTLTSEIRQRMRDLLKLDAAVSEEDHHQEILLLMLTLKRKYSFSMEGLLSPRFISSLRTAFGRDLLDVLERWEVHLYKGHRRKVRRAYLHEIDPEVDRSTEQAEDRRFRYASVIPSPETDYAIGLIVSRIKRLLPDTTPVQGFFADLVANADLSDHAPEGVDLYRSRYREYDRIPAKAMANVHGLSEHRRKEVLRKITEHLGLAGMVKGKTREYRKAHGMKRRLQGALSESTSGKQPLAHVLVQTETCRKRR
jgi:hypothetical protein